MVKPYSIDPGAWYDDATLHKDLRIRYAALERGRASGDLRYTRRGGRLLYRGQWIIDWLAGEPRATSEAQAQEALRRAGYLPAEAEAVAG